MRRDDWIALTIWVLILVAAIIYFIVFDLHLRWITHGGSPLGG